VSGAPPTVDDVAAQVMCAAYDAGLDAADEVTPRTLRHTYLAYLLRQGVRFADLGRIVGRLPQNEMALYMRLASPQTRVPFEQIDPVLPGLRQAASPPG
jgi:polysaccharide biosynthesis transport protein